MREGGGSREGIRRGKGKSESDKSNQVRTGGNNREEEERTIGV